LDWREEQGLGKIQALIQWQGLYPEDATWESIPELLKEFPNLHLEDKVFVEGKGDVIAQDENNDSVSIEDGFEKDNLAAKFKPKPNTNKPKYLEDYVTN